MEKYTIQKVIRYLVGGHELDTRREAAQYAKLAEEVDLLTATLVPVHWPAFIYSDAWVHGRGFVQHPRSSVRAVEERLLALTRAAYPHQEILSPATVPATVVVWTGGRTRLRPLYDLALRLARIDAQGREFCDSEKMRHAAREPGNSALIDLTETAMAATPATSKPPIPFNAPDFTR